MSRLIPLLLMFVLAGCGQPASLTVPSSERPMRVVSLDFCADQYVLKFADREQILAVSPDAVRGFSYMRDVAVGVPTVRPIAEDVLILKPDLIVRSYGGGPNAEAFFERAGVPVLQIGWASNIHGEDLSSIPEITKTVAAGLGQAERGEVVARDYLDRLESIASSASAKSTLYVTPSGVTTGGNSLVHKAMLAAGLQNYAARPGWHSLPLERLTSERPDLVAAAYFDVQSDHRHGWSAARHPIAKRELNAAELVKLEGAWLGCGGWFLIEAIEALAQGPVSP
ncbi:MAG: ABC transporter substrate-binding protein [Pseudomonadota bacterium]